MQRYCENMFWSGCKVFFYNHLSLQSKSTDTKPGGIQLEGEVKLLCLDAKRKQRQWLTLSLFAVGLWVWARDRNSLYRHCVCDCWNYSTVERFVHCHQGKPRHQKHTHSGKKGTLERARFFLKKNLARVSVVNNIPITRGGNHVDIGKCLEIKKNTKIIVISLLI